MLVRPHHLGMIRGFRHAGLRRLYERDDPRGIKADQVKRIRRALFLIDTATRPEEIVGLPGLRLHALAGDLRGYWSVSISGNWRIVFRFAGGDAFDLDLVDYH